MSIESLKTKFGIIEYSIIGKGKPIVFVHGGHSNCHDTLCHKGFDLEKYQLITPSRPGYGKTPLGENGSPLRAAELFVEILNSLKIKKAVIYGISAGGLTAIELAGNYPDRVSKLILASAISKKWLNKNEKVYKVAQKLFNPKFEQLTWRVIRFFSFIFPQIMANSFFSQFSTQPRHKLNSDDVKSLIITLSHYSSGEGFLNDIDQDIEDAVIGKVECPTLIIHSRNDNSVSISHPQNSKNIIRTSVYEILDNEWGHLFWIGQDSDESIARAIKFIEGNT